MSELKVQQPIVHTPKISKWSIQRQWPVEYLKGRGIEVWPEKFILDNYYYYTNLEGWGKILYDLVFKSSLYKTDIFDCEDFAMKAQVVCAERYGLNALRFCIGTMPLGTHGFNILFHGDEDGIDGVLLWEPNAGFECSGEAFDIGEYEYQPIVVLI